VADDLPPAKDLGEFVTRGNQPPKRGIRIPVPPGPGHVVPLRRPKREPDPEISELGTALLGDTLPAGIAVGTDLATASLLHEHHGEDLFFSPTLGWLAWDGCRFAPDDSGEVSRRAQNVGRRLELGAAEMMRRAARSESETEQQRLRSRAQALGKWARKAQSAAGIASAVELAQTLMPVTPTDLDADPWLFNCANGTLELRDGSPALREHRRTDRLTHLCPVAYDPAATAPRFEQFIAEILPDSDTREFVQRYLGYALTGSTREQCFVIALGTGANGKSVLTETVRHVLGDYVLDTPTSTIMAAEHGRGTENDLARLRGARFVTAKETAEAKRLDEARIKALTGGDVVTARFLFKEHFEFVPEFKLWLYANHRPEIRGADDGIWRRIALVPFEVTIPESQRDPELPAKLRGEAPGILAWLVRGCMEWQRQGLRPPARVTDATQGWRSDADDVARFVAECCTLAPFAEVKADALHKRYVAWTRDQGSRDHLASNGFSRRLAALSIKGFEQRRTFAKGRHYIGIGLESEPDRWDVQ
jgi:putative DNA primase/helicase